MAAYVKSHPDLPAILSLSHTLSRDGGERRAVKLKLADFADIQRPPEWSDYHRALAGSFALRRESTESVFATL